MKKPKTKFSDSNKELHKSLGVPAYEKQEMSEAGEHKKKSKKNCNCDCKKQ